MFKKLCLITVGFFCTGLFAARAALPAGQTTQQVMPQSVGAVSGMTQAEKMMNDDTFNFTIANPNTVEPKRFIFEIKPGEKAEDYVFVKNASDVPLKFVLYGSDGTRTAQGSFAVETDEQSADEVGKWITFEEKELMLQPGEGKKVKFRVEVPVGTPEGTYSGGVSAEKSKADTNNANIIIAVRIALRVDVKVTGDPQPVEKKYAYVDENPFFQVYFWASLGLFVLSAGALGWSYFKEKPSTARGKHKTNHRHK